MNLKNVINTKQFLDKVFLNKLFKLASEMENKDNNGTLPKPLAEKVLATVFYEPSTRTRFSFETAIHKLGGNVITTESAIHFSSVTKGETLSDTIKIISGYADAIILRHNEVGSAEIASEASNTPVINAGDGSGDHPTQGLLDIYTIKKELGKIENLKIAFVGDLLYGRTVHSLLYLLSIYPGIKFYFISPQQLKLPKKYINYLKEKNVKFVEQADIKKSLNKFDVLYITRIQKERFENASEYNKLKGSYVVDNEILNKIKERSIILHPLPRIDEIAPEVDSDKRAAYFREAKNGLYIRMALLQMIFES